MSAYREIADGNEELVVDATLDKAYPGCVVLRSATIRVRRGTVHALVGENGAGKSTLVKILAGVLLADAGKLVLGGTTRSLAGWSRAAARDAGVGIVQQHGAFAETLSVVENAVLGTEGGMLLSLDAPSAALAKLGKELGLDLDPRAIAGELTVGAAQRAEIIAALAEVTRGATSNADEPAAASGGRTPPLGLDEPTAHEPAAASGGRTPLLVRDTPTADEPAAASGGRPPLLVRDTPTADEPAAASGGRTPLLVRDTPTADEPAAASGGRTALLVLDEPTAVLTPIEVAGLLRTMRALADRGITVLFVTHKLDEVREVADDVTVLREGETVATFAKRDASLDPAAIARAMVGADLPPPQSVAAPASDAKPALELRDIHAACLVDANLVVRAGEIVGVAGIDGNGQSELARVIAGLLPVGRGTIELAGRPITHASPGARLRGGLAHVHEDRHHGGLLLDASVAENLSLGRRDITGRFRLDRARVDSFARERIADLDIRPPEPAALVRALSGGNQQKIVVARELSRPSIACVVASQPTRGVDLGAVARIHERLRDAARAGAGVLVISADLDELLALCHRIVVMLRGRIVGERVGDALHAAGAREGIGTLMTGAGESA